MRASPKYAERMHAVVKRLSRKDAADVLAGFTADPEMLRQGDVTDLDSAQNYIDFITDPNEGNHGFAVELDSQCGGVVGINGASAHRLGWFFYWMHPQFRGYGLTARAAATVANWALSSGGFERLELGHRVNNPASGAVAQAAGFRHEGTERKKFLVGGERVDVLTYGRLATDPLPQTHPLPLSKVE
ncbi:acetyltransferase [Nesterenkonia alkaliphila]|nr:acetyltransferase [Nesterenkonia alkaliphila]